MARYPSLEDNYTPIPSTFLHEAFHGAMGREELMVMLLFFHHTYGWKKERAFVQLSTVIEQTDLGKEGARQGITAALARGSILPMPMGDEDPAYLLATAENERFMELYGTASAEEEGFGPPPDSEATDPFAMPVPDSFDMPSDEIEVGSSDGFLSTMEGEHGSIDLGGETLSVEVECGPDAPLPETAALPPRSEDGPKERKPAARSGGELPYAKRSVEMLTRILGRWPSKDESARLVELGAEDEELVEAMSSLLSKTDNVYSSDLIVYEVESLRSRRRRIQRKTRSDEERAAQAARQKACRKCNGLGYVFIGVNEIRECACRKSSETPS